MIVDFLNLLNYTSAMTKLFVAIGFLMKAWHICAAAEGGSIRY